MNKEINLKIENRDTLHLKVSDVLRKAILNGDFEPGERLIQEELAEALGVSRMPIREALRKLEIEGLITLEPHRGAIVNPLRAEDIEEIYELRAQMEKMAVVRSVPQMTDEDIRALEKLVTTMKEVSEADAFVEANIEFHRLLMKHSKWNRLRGFIETLWNGFPQQTPHVLSNQVQLSNLEHDQILEAVKRKDAELAGKMIETHISRTGKALLNSLSHGKEVPTTPSNEKNKNL